MSIPTPEEFIDMFKNRKMEKMVKFAKIDSIYASGRPKLIFDGESVATIKTYPYLSSYTPAANDRVMLISNVIVGKIL